MGAIAEPTAGAATRPPLTRAVKLAYGVGDLGGAVTSVVIGFFLNAFLLDVAGLRPGAVGVIFLLAQIWDAVVDPYIGILSDRTRSRWGSKRPWLLFGAVPLGLAFLLHWVVPPLGQVGLFAYYLAVSLLLKTAFSAVNIPYGALTAELAGGYHERTQLTIYRFSFSIFGSLLAVALHPVLVGLGGDDVRRGHLISAGVWAVFAVLATLATFRFTRERVAGAADVGDRHAVVAEVRSALRNRPFLFVTGIYLCSWLCLLFVQNNLLLYARYAADVEAHFTAILLVYQVTAIVFLGVWARVSARIGKSRTYVAGVTLWAATLIALYFTPRGVAAPYFAVAFLAGVGAAVAYLIPWSLLPDVVEDDAARGGRRRDGLFYGLFVFLQQAGLSLGLAASNFALEAAGYINPPAGQVVAQPEAVLATLRVLVSFVPAAILLLSLPLALRFPLAGGRGATGEA